LGSTAPARPRRAGRLASGSAIREAAASLFLEKGYAGTSMDDIAAAAQVSKQTIYTHFANKEELFANLVLGNADRVQEFVGTIHRTLAEASDLESGLQKLARQYLGFVVRPDVLRLRRLVIGEAGRFPDLARTYYDLVPARVYQALAVEFGELKDRGALRADDPTVAAQHFVWLTLGSPLDRAMFYPVESTPERVTLDHAAESAARAFVAAYASPRSR
jgi:TetR/AcrR family transcriptional repressor of mexJK operon